MDYDKTFLTGKVKQVAKMLEAYRTVPAPDQQQALTHLKTIKQAIEQPKEDQPDLRADIIEANLGEAECHQTVREERWHDTVHCPYCFATDIERMPPSTQYSPYNFRYLCLACHSRFNDDSRTPFEAKIPSLETWIQCWFLLGCTNSFDYIAAKLNLDIEQVKLMISELRRVFNANQPLTQLMSYERWHKAHADKISARIKHEIILTKQELFASDTTEQPKDTAVVRRQKERRQAPKGQPPKF